MIRSIHFQNTVNSNIHGDSHLQHGSSAHNNKFHHLDPIEIDLQFYSKVPKKLIKQLYDTIYETDFEMLGYGYPPKYIDMGHD